MSDAARPGGGAIRAPAARPGWVRRGQRLALKLADLRAVRARRGFDGLRGRYYDTLWTEAARDVGASVTALPGGIHEIRRGALRTFVRRSELMLDSALAERLMADKTLTYRLFAEMGLNLPEHQDFSLSDMRPAAELLSRHPAGIVVKPATGTGGGRGVTTGIRDTVSLGRAARYAASFNARLLAEPQITGHNYRLLYLDGQLIDAVRRDPPMVTGDGRTDIAGLIRAENARRKAGAPVLALSPLIIDRDCLNTLAAAGHTPRSVPRGGERLDVKTAINENAAPQNHHVTGEVHPDIAAQGARIARGLGIRLAGLDLFSADIAADPATAAPVFGEINVAPGLHHHHLTAAPPEGPATASCVLAYLLDRKEGVMTL
ncbi:cyanophycin synthetase [Profundibacterium mesophilum]|uniref:Glutathione synthase n=1 Tax=Profundibacterium mesophilum KAUST100406-0324 TaxID=1037889 RepID=A0A921NYA9_9RHOB|nr:cyanophycin synthetase [Profundibacterium mesophilum]KAF0676944.1 glutathione synthase [Profundibacterium mesophilum KAUST100406-0324]